MQGIPDGASADVLPAYFGPPGWLGVDLTAGTDWQEISELVDASYRVTARRRLVKRLDED